MARHKEEQIIEALEALKKNKISTVARQYGVTNATLYTWEKKYGKNNQTKKPKEIFGSVILNRRILTTRGMLEYGQNKLGAKPRTINYWVAEHMERETIKLVKQGVYAVNKKDNPVSLAEISQYFFPKSVVSLDSVLDKKKENSDPVMIIIPCTYKEGESRPTTGLFQTAAGNIKAHAISGKLADACYNTDLLKTSCTHYRMATPEKALLDAYHCSTARGRSYVTPKNIKLTQINRARLGELCDYFDIPPTKIDDFIAHIGQHKKPGNKLAR